LNGDLVAAVSYDKVGTAMNDYDNVTLQVWRLPAATERLHVGLPYKLSLAQTLCFNQEGNYLAVGIGGNDAPHQGELLLVDDAGVITRIQSPIGPIWALAYDSRHALWAGSGGGAAVQLWDGQTNAPVASLASHTAAIETAHLNSAGDKLVLSTDWGETLAIDLTLGLAKQLPLRQAVIGGDPQVVAGIEKDFARALAYKFLTGKQVLQSDIANIGETCSAVALDKTGRYLIEKLFASERNSSTINVWDTSGKEKVKVLTTERKGYAPRLQVLPSGDVLVIEDTDGLALWRLSTREKLAEIQESAETAFLWIDKSTDSLTRVAVRTEGGDMKFVLSAVSVGDKVSVARLDALPQYVEAAGPGHTLLLLSGFAEAFYDWQSRRSTILDYVVVDSHFNTFKRVYTAGRYAMVNTVTNEAYTGNFDLLKLPGIETRTFTPDGKYYVGLTVSGDVLIWSLETGYFERSLKGHGAKISSWSFSDDGRLLVTATPLGEALLWNVESGELLATFRCLAKATGSRLTATDGTSWGRRGPR
jgi:WD40 repeat protein